MGRPPRSRLARRRRRRLDAPRGESSTTAASSTSSPPSDVAVDPTPTRRSFPDVITRAFLGTLKAFFRRFSGAFQRLNSALTGLLGLGFEPVNPSMPNMLPPQLAASCWGCARFHNVKLQKILLA